jgi:hypothetical protein
MCVTPNRHGKEEPKIWTEPICGMHVLTRGESWIETGTTFFTGKFRNTYLLNSLEQHSALLLTK